MAPSRSSSESPPSAFSASSLLPKLLPAIFPALLPPVDAVDYEYYEIMGFGNNSTSADNSNHHDSVEPCTAATLRAHYKRLSLQYHPDKNPTPEAAAHYTRIQQAHTVLNDPEQRQLYDSLGRSVARYESVQSGSFLHPTTVLYHVGAASIADKSRLVVCLLLLLLLIFLAPILIVVRWNHERRREDGTGGVPWMVVCLPIWIAFTVALVVQLVRVGTQPTATGVVWLLELMAWSVGVVLAVLQWDTITSLSWHVVAIPFYVGHVLHILKGYLSIRSIQVIQAYMISELYMRDELNVEDQQDLTEEQQKKYTVVSTDHDVVAQLLAAMEQANGDDSLDKEELEALRVHTSPEFMAAEQAMSRIFRSTLCWGLFYIPLTILIAFQLGSWNKNVSWWIVFIPLWIYWGCPLLFHFFVCCCAGPPLDDEDDDDVDPEKADDGQSSSQANTSQMMFQSVNGDMSQLNSFNTSADGSAGINTSSASIQTSGDVAPGASPTKPSSSATTTTTPMKREEPNIPAVSPIPETGNVGPSPTRGPMPRSNNDDDSDRDLPELSPEFVDAKFKALSACCGSTLQVGLLCMVVALLQDPDAYNAMWILFPGFLFGGLLLCLCCCCIYAPPLVDEHGNPLHGGLANQNAEDDDDLFVYKMDTPKHAVQPQPPPPSMVTEQQVSKTSIPEEGEGDVDIEAQASPDLLATTEEFAKDVSDDDQADPTASSMDDLD